MSLPTKLLFIFAFFFTLALVYLQYLSNPHIPKNGLKLWLRADVGVVTSPSGKVSQWTNQSESEINATMSKEERQPSLVDNGLNSQPVIRFEGQQSLSLKPFLSPDQFTLAVVGKNSNDSEAFSMILGPGGKSPNNQLRWENGSTALFVGTSNNFPIITSSIGNTRTYHLLVARYDGSTMTVYRDGAMVSSHDFKTSGPWTLGQVGAWYSRYFLVGDLAEIMVYDVPLKDGDMELITTYLKDKYDLP